MNEELKEIEAFDWESDGRDFNEKWRALGYKDPASLNGWDEAEIRRAMHEEIVRLREMVRLTQRALVKLSGHNGRA